MKEWLWFWRIDGNSVIFENGEVEAKIPLPILRSVLQEVRRK